MNQIDWQKIKMEYVTRGTSARELARKYKLQPTTVQRKSKMEDWPSQREEYVRTLTQKCVQRTQSDTVDSVARLAQSARKLMDKCNALLAMDDVVAPRDLKAVTDTLIGVKNLLGIKDEDNSKQEITVTFKENVWD